MRRQVLVSILGTVALALVLSGTGTYLLLRRQTVAAIDTGLRSEAETLAGLVADSQDAPTRIGQTKVVTGMRLAGVAVLVRGPAGVLRGELPEGVTVDDVPAADLQPGEARSGRHGQLSWASATVDGARGSVVTVVLTRESPTARAPLAWFLSGGGAALAVGAAVAAWLSDSLTRPLRGAEAATQRIAAGDLTVRLPDPAADAHDEVADLTRSINSMATSLATSQGLGRQFLLSVSHDLRTPLTSIRGYADAIADGTVAEPADAARVVSSEAQRLSRLVGDLLDLARLDAHAFTFDLRVVPVDEVAMDTAEGFRPTAEAAGITLAVTEPARSIAARVDPDRLAQALANLLENAVKHASAHVWVEAIAGIDGTASIRITDDGPGIAAGDLARVFERLYVTSRRPVRDVGGSGLGLAIVHELVAGMGGRVWVESPALADGTGARFVVQMPPSASPERAGSS